MYVLSRNDSGNEWVDEMGDQIKWQLFTYGGEKNQTQLIQKMLEEQGIF